MIRKEVSEEKKEKKTVKKSNEMRREEIRRDPFKEWKDRQDTQKESEKKEIVTNSQKAKVVSASGGRT